MNLVMRIPCVMRKRREKMKRLFLPALAVLAMAFAGILMHTGSSPPAYSAHPTSIANTLDAGKLGKDEKVTVSRVPVLEFRNQVLFGIVESGTSSHDKWPRPKLKPVVAATNRAESSFHKYAFGEPITG